MKRHCTDMGTLMAALVKYADSNSTKDPVSDDEKAGKGKKNGNSKGQQHHPGSSGGGKRKADGNMDFVANTNVQNRRRQRRGKGRGGGPSPNPERLNSLLNQPCPKHGTTEEPANHLWKDCYIMREFMNSNAFRYDHNPGGGSGSGPNNGGGNSGSGFNGNPNGHGNPNRHDNQHNQNDQGGYRQQQQQQSGYQSNPKQLNSGQYHVFTTSLDTRD